MAELASRGTIRIGVKYDIPNLGWLRPGDHQPAGFDVDLGRIVAERLGVEPEFVPVTSENRIPMLERGEVDLVVATMTIKDDRAERIDFSYPYLLTHQRLLVRKGSPVTSVDALDGYRGTVCVVRGSSPSETIVELAPHAESVEVRDHFQCLEMLEQGRADAFTTDEVILQSMRERIPTMLQLVGSPLTIEPYGMGIQKGHPEFVDFVNEVIREAKANGQWQKAYNRWIRPVMGQRPMPAADGQRFRILYGSPSQAVAPPVPAHG